MSGPITWRSIGGPNVGNPSQSMALATASFKDAFSGLGQALNEQNEGIQKKWDLGKEANTNAFLARLAEFQTPEEAAAAMPALRQELGGFGAQIDGAAARTALGSLQETLQRRAVQQQQYVTSNQKFTQDQADFKNQPQFDAIKGLLGSADQSEVNAGLTALQQYATAGMMTPRQEAELRGTGAARLENLAKTGREVEKHKFDLEDRKEDNARQDAMLRNSQGQLAVQQRQASLAERRLTADLEERDRVRTAAENAAGAAKIQTALDNHIKNSVVGGGTLDTQEGRTALLKQLKERGLEPNAIEDVLNEVLGGKRGNGTVRVKIDGKEWDMPIPVNTVLEGVDRNSEFWNGAHWSRRGNKAAAYLKDRLLDTDYINSVAQSLSLRDSGGDALLLQAIRNGNALVPGAKPSPKR